MPDPRRASGGVWCAPPATPKGPPAMRCPPRPRRRAPAQARVRAAGGTGIHAAPRTNLGGHPCPPGLSARLSLHFPPPSGGIPQPDAPRITCRSSRRRAAGRPLALSSATPSPHPPAPPKPRSDAPTPPQRPLPGLRPATPQHPHPGCSFQRRTNAAPLLESDADLRASLAAFALATPHGHILLLQLHPKSGNLTHAARTDGTGRHATPGPVCNTSERVGGGKVARSFPATPNPRRLCFSPLRCVPVLHAFHPLWP